MLAEIRETPLSLAEVVESVTVPTAGAIATFVGLVRNHSGGQPVERLEYHAYVSMADREMAKLVTQLEQEFPGVHVACLHRVGELTVGDAAVVCAASSPHRSDAFVVCRELIDRIKATVPIWKREHGGDGVKWVGWTDARVDTAGEPVT